jgi:segregation and condensation protein B
MQNLNLIVEAIVFAAGRVVSADEIRECIATVTDEDGPSDQEIADSIEALNRVYESAGLSLRIFDWAGGFRMATVPEVSDYLQAFFADPPRRLTRSLLETLSIVAYRQPVTKPEIDTVRGVDSSYALRRLMEQGFIAMVGRSETVGRPLLFGTTQKFLEEFGLSNLGGLPKLREAEELFQDDHMIALRREHDTSHAAEQKDKDVESVPEDEEKD